MGQRDAGSWLTPWETWLRPLRKQEVYLPFHTIGTACSGGSCVNVDCLYIGLKVSTNAEQFRHCCSHRTDQRHRHSLTALTSSTPWPSVRCVWTSLYPFRLLRCESPLHSKMFEKLNRNFSRSHGDNLLTLLLRFYEGTIFFIVNLNYTPTASPCKGKHSSTREHEAPSHNSTGCKHCWCLCQLSWNQWANFVSKPLVHERRHTSSCAVIRWWAGGWRVGWTGTVS